MSSMRKNPEYYKTSNITIRMNPIIKKKWQTFAKLNGQDLTSLLTTLVNWACSKPDLYKQIKREEM